MCGVVGIDPGAHGACALYCPGNSVASGLRWTILDMPTIFSPSKAKKRKGKPSGRLELNAGALFEWLRRFNPEHVYLELISPPASFGHGVESGEEHAKATRRGMGAAGAFQFGGVYFATKAVIACAGIPMTPITPQSWKKVAGISGPDKEVSRRRAIQLFPDQAAALARVKDEARAEAMLIAAVGARILGLDRIAA